MAGSGRKVFTAGDVLTASDVQNYLQDQTVMVFGGTAARSAAIATPTEGMLAVTTDNDEIDYYNGSAWVSALPVGAWTAFTPTWTGLTVGNGVYRQSHYVLIGKTAHVAIDFELGTTSSVSGLITAILPANLARKNIYNTGTSYVSFHDTGLQNNMGVAQISTLDAKNWLIRPVDTTSTYGTITSTSATIPFTWGSTDRIVFAATFEVA
jgi:hypothetical protein